MKQRSERYYFLESIFLSMASLGVYNLIIQFVVYPAVNRTLGAELFGGILTLISVQSVLAVSIGAGVNYARMANVPKFTASNADYNLYLLPWLILTAVGTAGSLFYFGAPHTLSFALYPLLSVLMALRYYASVAFRLEINYRKNFLFYILISAGYLLGLLVFRFTKLWETALLPGEALAIAYVVFASPIFRRPLLRKSEHFKAVCSSGTALVFSQLFANLTLHADRLLIGAFADSRQVTIFYTASLLGKAMAMLTEPIAGVAVGYLARSKSFGRKQYLLCAGATLALGALIFLLFLPIAPFVIGILYPDIVSDASPLFAIANGGQILYFVANLLLVILLRFTKEKYQFIINVSYCVAFFAVCIPAVLHGGLSAFCMSVLLLNVVRLTVVFLLGFIQSSKGDNTL